MFETIGLWIFPCLITIVSFFIVYFRNNFVWLDGEFDRSTVDAYQYAHDTAIWLILNLIMWLVCFIVF